MASVDGTDADVKTAGDELIFETGESEATTDSVTQQQSDVGNDTDMVTECPGTSAITESGDMQEDVANKEMVDFKVVFNKQRLDVSFPVDDKVSSLKAHIHKITGVTPAMQKLMFKGLMQDEKTLRELNVSTGAKLMLVGSKLNDVIAVSSVNPEKIRAEDKAQESVKKEPVSRQKMHKKVIDRGIPEDCMAGVKSVKERLPPVPVHGFNKNGSKVRLTFKLESDQLWIGTKERTDKIPMASIKNIVSEAIEKHEQYHIVGIQLGPTEASRYWIYWFPAQYVDALKDTVMGKWQFF
ncbi:PREDICTED: ubiquitin domain-containing protein UBFD1-like isoform X2 [Priapulus caudatus]|uniref:Ubiquitin domain-containing protein UBFD1-like isoform X2 n=1 Tax=Priapulus caudatus TaxID=37621 RepID=A0ABM1DPC9_PRICU|nr:PREDICTED: ubiquitin domain-containing protein UBFD1-like isoform X2 [Priapulus caudatus]